MDKQLPEPPLRVFAIADGHHFPRWWLSTDEGVWWWFHDVGGNSGANPAESIELKVVANDRNDPEAVELISSARRAAADGPQPSAELTTLRSAAGREGESL